MLVNVTNSHDISLFKSFYETYGHKDIIFRHSRLDFDFDKKIMEYFENDKNPHFCLKGVQEMVNFEFIRHQLSPDQAITIKESAIKTRSDSDKSEIICTLSVTFTRLYDIESRTMYEDIVQNLVLRNDSLSLSGGSSEPLISDASESSFILESPPLTSICNQSGREFEISGANDKDQSIMRVLEKPQPIEKIEATLPNIFEYYAASRGVSVPIYSR